MVVHYLLFIFTALFAKAAEKPQKTLDSESNKSEETRAAFIAAIIAFIPAIIFYGLRDGLGDTASYIDTFSRLNPQNIFDGFSDRSPGYDVFQNFIKLYITKNPHVFLFILTIISVLLMLRVQSRYSPMFALSVFIFFGSTEISYVFNGARQFLAIAIMFYSLKYAEQKKLIKYIICCIIACSVHQTSIIVIPAYFLARGKLFNIKIIITGITTIFATAFSSLFIDYINDMFISESVYANYYDHLIDSEGINIFRVLVAAIPFVLCMIYKKRIDKLDDPVLNYCANMSILALAVSIFAAASGGDLLGRLAEYYLIYNTLTYPIILKRVVSKNISNILLAGLIIGYFFFYWYQFSVIWHMGYQSNTLGISIGMEDV